MGEGLSNSNPFEQAPEESEDANSNAPGQKCVLCWQAEQEGHWIFLEQCWMLLEEMRSESQSRPEPALSCLKLIFTLAFTLYEIGKSLKNFEQQRNIYI